MPITKQVLSGSTDGRGILIAATSGTGTLIHTGSNSSSVIDEVWLYISNPDSTVHTVTFQWGGTTSPNDIITTFVNVNQGLILVSPGLVLNGNATQLNIRAFADAANKVTIFGYVNRIS